MNKKLVLQVLGDITGALTVLSVIPYDKDTMSMITQILPASWLPYFIKICILSTLLLRVAGHYMPPPAP